MTGILIAIYAAGTWAVTPPQQHRLLATHPDNPRLLLSLNASALYTGVAAGTAIGGAVISTTHSIVALCLGGASFQIAALLVLALSEWATQQETARRGAGPREGRPAGSRTTSRSPGRRSHPDRCVLQAHLNQQGTAPRHATSWPVAARDTVEHRPKSNHQRSGDQGSPVSKPTR